MSVFLLAGSLAMAQESAPTPAPAPAAEAPKTEAKAAAEEGWATVVFFRPKRFVGSGLTPSIYIDDVELARLDNGRHVTFKVKAGKRNLKSSMKSHAGLEMEFKAGETYYLEMAIQTGNWRGGGRLIPAPAEDAKAAMAKLKPLDKKWLQAGGNADVAKYEEPAAK